MNKNKQFDWDVYFLGLAKEISKKSKDPSTKVGAVIVNNENRIVSTGYNGLAKKTKDTPERLNDRDAKIMLMIHGEMNAILFAKEDLTNCTVYTHPFAPCSNCASVIIQKGIRRVVYPKGDAELLKRWEKSLKLSEEVLKEAGIEMLEINMENK